MIPGGQGVVAEVVDMNSLKKISLEQEQSRWLMKPVDFWHSISLQTTILLAEFKHLTVDSSFLF